MSFIFNFLKQFCEPSVGLIKENFVHYEGQFLVKNHKIEEITHEHLSFLLKGNDEYKIKYYLKIAFDAQDAINQIVSNDQTDLRKLNEEISERLKHIDDDEQISIEITIDKKDKLSENILPIFDLSAFSDCLKAQSISERFETWGSLFDFNNQIHCYVWDKIKPFQSPTISFLSFDDEHINIPVFQSPKTRELIINNRCKSCYLSNESKFNFIPEDFYFNKNSDIIIFDEYFSSLYNILLVIYLSDFSEIKKDCHNNDIISYKMKGYKLITEELIISDGLNIINEELKNIYLWVYNAGNFIDKIGLARNVISIHLSSNSIFSITEGTIKSIESNYDIYLKENVKQYIEIKNKISEFLLSQSDKASDIIKNMLSTLKSSLWSVVTFFLTVCIIRMLNAKDSSGIITTEILWITYLFIFFSFLYLLLINKEVKEDQARLMDKYDKIKSRYKDILNEDDLNKIIDTDKLKTEESDFINSRRLLYIKIWGIANIAIFIVITSLYSIIFFIILLFILFIGYMSLKNKLKTIWCKLTF